jgi:hypothetical protein
MQPLSFVKQCTTVDYLLRHVIHSVFPRVFIFTAHDSHFYLHKRTQTPTLTPCHRARETRPSRFSSASSGSQAVKHRRLLQTQPLTT